MSDAPDLKPCPFCGGEAERITIEDDSDPSNFGGDVIQCRNCIASSRVVFGEKEGIEDAWNRRATPPEVAALVKALRDENEQLREECRGYLAVWAVEYAARIGLSRGELHPQHYDRLTELGARMVDFSRATSESN